MLLGNKMCKFLTTLQIIFYEVPKNVDEIISKVSHAKNLNNKNNITRNTILDNMNIVVFFYAGASWV